MQRLSLKSFRRRNIIRTALIMVERNAKRNYIIGKGAALKKVGVMSC
jgi:GTPase Era involved in 16S rRNA processing